MYVLTKFFGTEQYQKELVEGDLYLSSLAEYSKIVPERGLEEAARNGDSFAAQLLAKIRNTEQMDIFEGAVASVSPNKVPEIQQSDLKDHVCRDVVLKAKRYDYCNVACFCRIDYELSRMPGATILHWNEPDMKAFGDYAIIVKNPMEFLRKLQVGIDKLGYKCLCGPVNYHQLTLNVKKAPNKNSLILRRDDSVEIDSYTRKFNYDAFDKMNRYKKQHEWRIIVNNDIKNEDLLRIPLGDLSDIVLPVKRAEFGTVLDELLRKSQVLPVRDGYYGNFSREEMRKQFYEMGDNRCYLMITVG